MARDKRDARRLGAWICFEDESGLMLRPTKGRSWGRRVGIPVIVTAAAGGREVSLAGLACYQSGRQARLVDRLIIHRGRTSKPKGVQRVPWPTSPPEP